MYVVEYCVSKESNIWSSDCALYGPCRGKELTSVLAARDAISQELVWCVTNGSVPDDCNPGNYRIVTFDDDGNKLVVLTVV